MKEQKVVIMHPRDNVATAIRDLKEGEEVWLEEGQVLIALKAVPFGHKIALRPIPEAEDVIKYGESIGLSFAPIKAGEHVHIHNLEGKRGRGDQQGGKGL
jgi:altronate dehydratase small subunit